jgi:hypothetical protein
MPTGSITPVRIAISSLEKTPWSFLNHPRGCLLLRVWLASSIGAGEVALDSLFRRSVSVLETDWKRRGTGFWSLCFWVLLAWRTDAFHSLAKRRYLKKFSIRKKSTTLVRRFPHSIIGSAQESDRPPVLLGFCRRSFPDAATSVCAAIALEPMVIWVSRGSGSLRGGPEQDN